MGLSQVESKLPLGFRFFPSDEELVCHYLCKKLNKEKVWEGMLVEVDLHTSEPWELPDVAKLSATEWYFFSFRDRKYSTGSRANRATKTGYWKATGKDRSVHHPKTHALVGMRKTLVFYHGRAPNGIKTSWVMHEFRMETLHMPPKEDWVLCRVFSKGKGERPSSELENYASSNIMESSSLMGLPTMATVVGYDDQLAMTFPTFPTQEEDNNINNINNKSFMNLEIPQYNLTGFGGSMTRPEDDHGLLLGDQDMTSFF